MSDSNSPRQDHRDRKSALVSLLLLAGLGVGGAGFFSQHYRIEFVPKGQNRVTAPQATVPGSAAVGSTGVAAVEPEVILVDGCDFADEEPAVALLPRRLAPRTQLKASRQQATPQPCDDELLADITKTGSSAPRLALLSTLTEFQDDPVLGLQVDPMAAPAISAAVYPASGDLSVGAYLPGMSTLGGGGGSLPGGGITSLPALENSNPPLSAPSSELLNTPLPGTADTPNMPSTQALVSAQVPEPGSLALLGIGLLGVTLVRRRRLR